mmetsp:Transcript_2002/g.4632  ORF Transcript_2002/g.4632 Transcript_2002/m.4632 type:complete len:83 (+) Transcript_2002:2-250(+)
MPSPFLQQHGVTLPFHSARGRLNSRPRGTYSHAAPGRVAEFCLQMHGRPRRRRPAADGIAEDMLVERMPPRLATLVVGAFWC